MIQSLYPGALLPDNVQSKLACTDHSTGNTVGVRGEAPGWQVTKRVVIEPSTLIKTSRLLVKTSVFCSYLHDLEISGLFSHICWPGATRSIDFAQEHLLLLIVQQVPPVHRVLLVLQLSHPRQVPQLLENRQRSSHSSGLQPLSQDAQSTATLRRGLPGWLSDRFPHAGEYHLAVSACVHCWFLFFLYLGRMKRKCAVSRNVFLCVFFFFFNQ